MHSASARLESAAQRLKDGLASVNDETTQLLGSGWKGGAASAYGPAWDQWHQGAEQVIQGLQRMSELLTIAGKEYAKTDQSGADALGSTVQSSGGATGSGGSGAPSSQGAPDLGLGGGSPSGTGGGSAGGGAGDAGQQAMSSVSQLGQAAAGMAQQSAQAVAGIAQQAAQLAMGLAQQAEAAQADKADAPAPMVTTPRRTKTNSAKRPRSVTANETALQHLPANSGLGPRLSIAATQRGRPATKQSRGRDE